MISDSQSEPCELRELSEAVNTMPPWVSTLLGSCDVSETPAEADDYPMRVAEGSHFALSSVTVPGALSLRPLEFQRATTCVYHQIARAVARCRAPHLVRFWNLIPHIHARIDDAMDQYMVFNAGRFAAYLDWYGDERALEQQIPTATGIGHRATDLVIHALSADQPGRHVNNPRQRRPHCYSRGHGPLPPCFSRATIVESESEETPVVMVAGTASIRGQESVHIGDAAAQTEETFRNMANVLRVGCEMADPNQDECQADDAALLGRFRDLRVYCLRHEDLPTIRRLTHEHVPHLTDVEFLQAEVCRPELLVEIEGTAKAGVGVQDS